jgi:hypothetical protein
MGEGWRSIGPAAGAAFATSLLLALYFTPIFRDSARRFGIVDCPDGELKTQKEAVPYLGGLDTHRVSSPAGLHRTHLSVDAPDDERL